MAQTDLTIPYQEGHNYGVGAELTTGSARGLAVKPTPSQVKGAGGGSVRFALARVSSSTDVEDKLGISAEASAGCGSFGGSARFDFVKTCHVHTESLFLAVSANVRLAAESIDDPVLTDDAAALAAEEDRFRERYGTMFVRGLSRGGVFLAVLRIETASAEEASSINAELQGAYGTFSGEANTTIQKTIKTHNLSASAVIYAEGGDPAQMAPYLSESLDPAKLLDASETWLQTVQAQPVPYQVRLAPLVIARGAPPPANVKDLEKAQDVLVHCAQLRSALLDGLNTLVYVAEHPDRYETDESGGSLGELQEDFAQALDLVAKSARDATRDAAAARMPESYFDEAGLTMPRIPQDLFRAVVADTVETPDLSSAGSWSECVSRLEAIGLTAAKAVGTGDESDVFRVLSSDPKAGEKVGKGATVTVTVHEPVDFSKLIRLKAHTGVLLDLKPNG